MLRFASNCRGGRIANVQVERTRCAANELITPSRATIFSSHAEGWFLTGNLAAAHIFVTAFPANAASGALVTGFASGTGGGGGGTFIPEPGSLALLGVAMLG